MGSCTSKSVKLSVKETENRRSDVYKMGKALGTGSFGEVRLITNKETGHERAVKIFRKSLYQSSKSQIKLKKEIEILKQLDHPNIIRLYEYFEDEKKLYIIMEKCEGGELYSQITKSNIFSEAKASKIMRQLLSAVEYLHENKIVHRDIKPENILFESKDDLENIKLIDFGVAYHLSDLEKLEESVGTLYYVAPEVLNQDYDERCDLWSCGVIAYMILCGKPPFDGKKDEEIIERIKIGKFEFNSPVWDSHSTEAKDLIVKLLSPAKNRITAIEALQHPWIVHENLSQTSAFYTSALESLRNFHCNNKLKEAIRLYITTQCLGFQDTKELTNLFQEIDTNGDGKISKEELLDYYVNVMGPEHSEEEVEKIMKEVDTDNSGFVDYSEFIKATVSDKLIANMNHLKCAFQKFDVDNSGKISANEIKAVLSRTGENIDENIWEQIIKQADQNSDGEIDFKEFKDLVLGSQ